MSKVLEKVIKYAQQIKDKKSNKVIYVDKFLNVHLIDELPEGYYRKTDILIVDDPIKYMKEITKREPTANELKQFTLVGSIIDVEPVEEFKELPIDVMKEQLLRLPIGDIVKNRRISKEYKGIIDENNFWCDLIRRDYPNIKFNKDACENDYKEAYKLIRTLTVTNEKIESVIKKYKLDMKKLKKYIDDDLINIGFKREGDKYVYKLDINENFYEIIRDLIYQNIPDNYIPMGNMKFHMFTTRSIIDRETYYKIFKEILPVLVDFDTSRNIDISLQRYIMLYNIINNYSFNKDFISVANSRINEHVQRRNTKPVWSAEQMLQLIYEIANYKGEENYKRYFIRKYNLEEDDYF